MGQEEDIREEEALRVELMVEIEIIETPETNCM